MKEVKFYFNADGTFGDVAHHVASMTAAVDADASLDEIEQDLNIALKTRQLDAEAAKVEKAINAPKFRKENTIRLIQRLKQIHPSLDVEDVSKLKEKSEADLKKILENLWEDIRTMQDDESQNTAPLFNRRTRVQRNSSETQRDFGPPTQYNSSGNGVLQQKQLLNATTTRP